MSDLVEPPPGAARLAYFTPIREYPPLADRKASVLLAAFGLMISVVLTFSRPVEQVLVGSNRWSALLVLTLLVPLASLVLLGSWNAFLALTRPIPPMPDSMAFYVHIARVPLATYRDRVRDLDHARAVLDMLHYNYSLASLSVLKFRLVDRSIVQARLSFALWLILLAVIALIG